MAIKQVVQMREDAKEIFLAGLQAVEPGEAIKRYCWIEVENLIVHDKSYDLSQFKNIFIIGAGKAGAPMASACLLYTSPSPRD